MNRNLVGSTCGRFCIKFPQSRMKGERHMLSSVLSLQLRSISSLGVVFRGIPVLWRSFTLPAWVHGLLQLNNDRVAYIESISSLSVRHATPCHSNRWPSLCICLFSTCHVEIEFRKLSFTCTARADTDLKPPPNLSCVKVQVNL